MQTTLKSHFGWQSDKDIVVDEYIRGIKEIKQRVYEIYRHSQIAVDSDEALVDFYRNIYTIKRYSEVSTIKRTGRYWRQTCPQTFVRTVDRRLLDSALEVANRQVWTT